jgi:hypothetical protein
MAAAKTIAAPRHKPRIKRKGRHAKKTKARDRRTPLMGPRAIA